MNILKYLLLPFTIIYAIVSLLIDYLYQKGIWGSTAFSLPVIAVGNLNTGGTGKTPMIIFLAKMLSRSFRVAIISRGYKRKTFGFRIVSDEDSYEIVGDEPAMMKRVLPETVIAVAENRILGIPHLLAEHPEIDIILLDDAFQQRGIRPALNILLTAAHRPFHKDFLLPFGRLRELKRGAKRADFLVITKCEEASDAFNTKYVQEQELPVLVHQSVYSTQLLYGDAYQLHQPDLKLTHTANTAVIAFAGIADEAPLKKYLDTHFAEVVFIKYPDHHNYSESDIQRIAEIFDHFEAENKCLLTTEKDAIKLENTKAFSETTGRKLFVLPIEISFGTLNQELRFQTNVFKKLGLY
jgi:tetraacyldisaccharide 4'-kinase